MYNKPNFLLLKGNQLKIRSKVYEKYFYLYNKTINVCTKYVIKYLHLMLKFKRFVMRI